jgi:queuine tRNA-ribosyltransferase
MSFSFQLEATCGRARAGRFITPHGEVQTPVFMPVGTVATVKGVPQDILDQLGVQILLNNTYHLYLRPGVETIRALGGVQKFMAWNKPILTDSGGFQVFSLASLRKISEEGVQFRSHIDGSAHMFSPESSIAAEIGLGADIIMAFDECTEYPATRERAQKSMELTTRWARRSRDYFAAHYREVPWYAEQSRLHGSEQRQALFGIVQGGMYLDLRRESAERMVEMDFDGHAIGGLSVGEPRENTWEVVESTIPLLPENKPRYVMGVGTPEEIVNYVRLGVDMMDCVLPTRAARHGLLFTSEGKINIKNARFVRDEGPLEPECPCPVCTRYSRAYLRHLYASQELLAQTLNTIHNLAFYLGLMRRVRESIMQGEFPGMGSLQGQSPAV